MSPYLGDLEKTQIIHNLVQTKMELRDENWQRTFLENLAGASFQSGEAQVVTGPDGYPYFQLFLPEPGKRFECFVIEKMIDDFLLRDGLGVVINPTTGQPDWVLSYGDILNYYLHKEFYSHKGVFTKEMNNEVMPKNAPVFVGEPSESLLPKITRKLLRVIFQQSGISSPKVLLMQKYGNQGSQELIFNITPEDFPNESLFNHFMRSLGWYFPRHYSYAGMREDTYPQKFSDL